MKYRVVGLFSLCFLVGCTSASYHKEINYLPDDCCHYGSFNNDRYELGNSKSTCQAGCYNRGCCTSIWR